MIKVFYGGKGTGKTKRLIGRANEYLKHAKGDSIYIDVNAKNMFQLKRSIRFVNTNELKIKDTEGFYGLICGLVAQNYDVENVYIDNLISMIDLTVPETIKLFKKLKEFSQKFNINLFMNIDCDNSEQLPEFLKEYAA